jgi:hypothetical protein
MAEKELEKISASLAAVSINVNKLLDSQRSIESRVEKLEESALDSVHMRQETFRTKSSFEDGPTREDGGGYNRYGLGLSDHVSEARGPHDDYGCREAADGIKDFDKVRNQLQNIDLRT